MGEREDWDGTDRRQLIEEEKKATFWSGTAVKVLTILVGIISFIGAYMFTEITGLPKTYADKEYVTSLHQKMDAGFKDLRGGIAEINRYLRDMK